jgi:hypothetical protein
MTPSSTVAPSRGAQRVSSGLGHHFVSPKKPRDKNKTQKSVELPGVAAKRRRLLAQMEQLINPEPEQTANDIHIQHAVTISDIHETDIMTDIPNPDFDIPSESPSTKRLDESRDTRRTLPDRSTDILYTRWKALIPTLIEPHLKYSTRMLATALQTVPPVISACAAPLCPQKQTPIVCLFFDSKSSCLLACTRYN